MLSSSVLTFSATIAGVVYGLPLSELFTNPNMDKLASVQQAAGGSLPNGALPPTLSANAVTALQLVATGEIFEVNYFSSLLKNITSGVEGYGPESYAPLSTEYVTETISTVVNQEVLHAVGVNLALKNAGVAPREECQYQYPVADFKSAIALAATFTDVVLGTLPAAQAIFAADGGDESPLVPLFGSVLAQEGEQNGYYRLAQLKTPSAAPFLTGGSPSFTFTALQGFIVPNSCPQPLSDIALKTFGKLEVVGTPAGKDALLSFAVPGEGQDVTVQGNSIVYVSGQNLPVTVPISEINYGTGNGKTSFKAQFPFVSKSFANGLTIAALVRGTGDFKSADAVAEVTVNGPGLIEVN